MLGHVPGCCGGRRAKRPSVMVHKLVIKHSPVPPWHCPAPWPRRGRLFVRTSQRRVTSTKNTTRRPKWNESFDLPVHVPEHQELVGGWLAGAWWGTGGCSVGMLPQACQLYDDAAGAGRNGSSLCMSQMRQFPPQQPALGVHCLVASWLAVRASTGSL